MRRYLQGEEVTGYGLRRETFSVCFHSLWFSVGELFPDEGVHLVLDAGGLLGVMKGKETEDGIELADLGDTQVLQVVQYTLFGGGEERNHTDKSEIGSLGS